MIGNLKNEGKDTVLRVISGKAPDSSAVLVEPSLEDLYLYYFSEEAGHGTDGGF